MKLRFPMVTTRTGDSGTTGDYSGKRDWKDAPIFELLGELDELNSALGVAKHHLPARDELHAVQRALIELGSLVATDPITSPERYAKLKPFGAERIDILEKWQQSLLGETELSPEFVLPGATLASAHTDLARTVCRRAERRLVGFMLSLIHI